MGSSSFNRIPTESKLLLKNYYPHNNECMRSSTADSYLIYRFSRQKTDCLTLWVKKIIKYWSTYSIFLDYVKCMLVTITMALHPRVACIPSRPIVQTDIVNKYAGGLSLLFLKETHFLWRLWIIYPQYVLKLRLGVNDVGEPYLMAYGWTLWNTDVYK